MRDEAGPPKIVEVESSPNGGAAGECQQRRELAEELQVDYRLDPLLMQPDDLPHDVKDEQKRGVRPNDPDVMTNLEPTDERLVARVR